MGWLTFIGFLVVSVIAIGVVSGVKRHVRFSVLWCALALCLWPITTICVILFGIGDLMNAAIALAEVAVHSVSLGMAHGEQASPPQQAKAAQARVELKQAGRRGAYHAGRIGARAASYLGFMGALEEYDRRAKPVDGGGPLPATPAQAQAVAGVAGPYAFQNEYHIVERMPTGGSTAKLFKVQRLIDGKPQGDLFVLKYFDLTHGSHLENIIRESHSVEQALRLGIVIDAKTLSNCYYYVMPYYHGESLSHAIQRLHRDLRPGDTLPPHAIEQIMVWLHEVLAEIYRYHKHGLFHKDIKPDNIIVNVNRAYLIDVGLVTPMDSSLLLTTHGTEYFRDPDMVRMAIQGLKIKDADCVKFDLYSLGATLYSMLEGSFPASGSLSRYSKKVPYVLQSITNKAMTDTDKRYASMEDMLRDVEEIMYLARLRGWENVKVTDLASFGGANEFRFVPPTDTFNAQYRPGQHEPSPLTAAAVLNQTVPPEAGQAPGGILAAAADLTNAIHDQVATKLRARADFLRTGAAPETPPAQAPAYAPAYAVLYEPKRLSSFFWGLVVGVLLLMVLVPVGVLAVFFMSGTSQHVVSQWSTSIPAPQPVAVNGTVAMNHLPDAGAPALVVETFRHYRKDLFEKWKQTGRVVGDVEQVPLLVLGPTTADAALNVTVETLRPDIINALHSNGIPLADNLEPQGEEELRRLLAEFRANGNADALYDWLRQRYADSTIPYLMELTVTPATGGDGAADQLALHTCIHYERQDFKNQSCFPKPANAR